MARLTKKEFTERISNTQDNNVLVKGHSPTDYLSCIIEEAINNNTNRGKVDAEGVANDLEYAIDQIQSALDAVNSIGK